MLIFLENFFDSSLVSRWSFLQKEKIQSLQQTISVLVKRNDQLVRKIEDYSNRKKAGGYTPRPDWSSATAVLERAGLSVLRDGDDKNEQCTSLLHPTSPLNRMILSIYIPCLRYSSSLCFFFLF